MAVLKNDSQAVQREDVLSSSPALSTTPVRLGSSPHPAVARSSFQSISPCGHQKRLVGILPL
jgi:hypothetical protein